MNVHVLKAGLLTTIQDAGRFGYASLGIGAAGACDGIALRLGNALAGNPGDTAALEFTLVGPRLRFDAATTIALIGEMAATLNGAAVLPWRPLHVVPGDVLDAGALRRGSRGYVAIAGGLALPEVLDSLSTDINAGIGPMGGRALRVGDVLTLRVSDDVRARRKAATATTRSRPPSPLSNWSLDPSHWFDFDGVEPLRLLTGSHFDQLDASSRAALFESEFRIAAESNRVGWRLQGPPLRLSAALELVSAGVTPGTLQLPRSGQPIVLGVEGPTTGGYPRIGHVIGVDLPRFAQRRPGDAVRFALTDLPEARRLLRDREIALQQLESAIHARLHA